MNTHAGSNVYLRLVGLDPMEVALRELNLSGEVLAVDDLKHRSN